jgi:hypothetical protein
MRGLRQDRVHEPDGQRQGPDRPLHHREGPGRRAAAPGRRDRRELLGQHRHGARDDGGPPRTSAARWWSAGRPSKEKLDALRAMGVELVLVDGELPPEHPESYNRKARHVAAETPTPSSPTSTTTARTTRPTTTPPAPRSGSRWRAGSTAGRRHRHRRHRLRGRPLPQGAGPGDPGGGGRPPGLGLHRLLPGPASSGGRAVPPRGARRRGDHRLPRVRAHRRHAPGPDREAFRAPASSPEGGDPRRRLERRRPLGGAQVAAASTARAVTLFPDRHPLPRLGRVTATSAPSTTTRAGCEDPGFLQERRRAG